MYKTHIVKRAASLLGALLLVREPSAAQRFVLIVCLILLPCVSSPSQSSSGQMTLDFPSATRPQTKMMTVDDVIRLSKAGLSDDVIIQQIRNKNKDQSINLSTDQLLQLKGAHVSDRVIGMLSNPDGSALTQDASAVAEVVKRSSESVVQIVVSDASGQQAALGSGFLISADGRIVTNDHVIKGGHSAIVKLTNGAFFPVEGILAADPDKDIAIIKVAGKNLPFLALANSDAVHVGDHVVAIGSPLGLEGTVSDGIISALREDGPNKCGARRWSTSGSA